ncbi:2-C-methyl-D-erythritol 4-phosphate cytidylyltransferase [Rhodobacterales bacterium HKCCE3408]|nr:2-C-methyl-D-erythritol 4-phosphate cytidylyltransferase [Rhodobacterales bacterium HKCCE3408]
MIVAAGRGHRLGAEMPKQYLPLGDRCVLRRTIEAFLATDIDGPVLCVIHPDDRTLYDEAVAGLGDPRLVAPVSGGANRAASVRAGLEALAERQPAKVLIHDAARPFISVNVISAVRTALDTADGAFAALPVVDALWRAEDGLAIDPVPRAGLWRAQTPQGFRFEAILSAHRASDAEAADDVAVARAAGLTVQVVPGDEANFKITSAADLERGRALLG